MEKRGSTHIEEVIAFVLFFGAIAAVIVYFNPFKTTTYMTFSPEQVMSKIESQIQSNVLIYTVVIREDKVDNGKEKIIIRPGPLPYSKLTVKDIEKNEILDLVKDQIKCTAGNVCIRWKNSGNSPSNNHETLKIYNSDHDDSSSPQGDNPEDFTPEYYYNVSAENLLVVSRELVESKLKGDYDDATGYNNLKNSLGLPLSKDFSFEVIIYDTPNIQIVPAKPKIPPRTAEVSSYSKTFKIMSEGEFFPAEVRLKIW